MLFSYRANIVSKSKSVVQLFLGQSKRSDSSTIKGTNRWEILLFSVCKHWTDICLTDSENAGSQSGNIQYAISMIIAIYSYIITFSKYPERGILHKMKQNKMIHFRVSMWSVRRSDCMFAWIQFNWIELNVDYIDYYYFPIVYFQWRFFDHQSIISINQVFFCCCC